MRVTDEDGKILTDCKKCRHNEGCNIAFGGKCEYNPGLEPHYVFHCGKHKGEHLSEVIANDPQYVVWMVANTKWFELSEVSCFELTQSHDGYDKLLYNAQVEHEINFISNRKINEDIQADSVGSPF